MSVWYFCQPFQPFVHTSKQDGQFFCATYNFKVLVSFPTCAFPTASPASFSSCPMAEHNVFRVCCKEDSPYLTTLWWHWCLLPLIFRWHRSPLSTLVSVPWYLVGVAEHSDLADSPAVPFLIVVIEMFASSLVCTWPQLKHFAFQKLTHLWEMSNLSTMVAWASVVFPISYNVDGHDCGVFINVLSLLTDFISCALSTPLEILSSFLKRIYLYPIHKMISQSFLRERCQSCSF